jgi:alpha-tubulin suppressor-like RCC1 family protein
MKKLLCFLIIISFNFINAFAVEDLTSICNQLKKSIIMFIDSNEVFLNGNVQTIDLDSKVVPYIEDSRTLVPIRLIIEQFSGIVEWDEKKQEVSITIGGENFIFKINDKTIFINGQAIIIDVAPRINNGKTFIPLRVISEQIKKRLFYEDGIIIISNDEIDFKSISVATKKGILKSLKNGDFFSLAKTNNKDQIFSNSDYYNKNPISKYITLKNSGELILKTGKSLFDVRTDTFYEELKKSKAFITNIDGAHMLDKENNLYKPKATRVYYSTYSVEPYYTYITFDKLKSDIIDFSVGTKNLITLNKDCLVEVVGNTEMVPMIANEKQPFIISKIYKELDNVSSVYAGDEVCFVIKKDGTVWGWGKNEFGQLGDGTKIDKKEPTLISGIKDAVFISTCSTHTTCITKDGSLWVWGRNTNFQLSYDIKNIATQPIKLNNLSDVQYVSTSDTHTLVLKKDGTVWSVGDNKNYQLGIGTMGQKVDFTKVEALKDIVYVGAFKYVDCDVSFAVDKNGVLYSWGVRNYNIYDKIMVPTKIDENLELPTVFR